MASTPEITLGLKVEFDIDERTRAALVALGWTPPDGGHEHVWERDLCDDHESCECGARRYSDAHLAEHGGRA